MPAVHFRRVARNGMASEWQKAYQPGRGQPGDQSGVSKKRRNVCQGVASVGGSRPMTRIWQLPPVPRLGPDRDVDIMAERGKEARQPQNNHTAIVHYRNAPLLFPVVIFHDR